MPKKTIIEEFLKLHFSDESSSSEMHKLRELAAKIRLGAGPEVMQEFSATANTLQKNKNEDDFTVDDPVAIYYEILIENEIDRFFPEEKSENTQDNLFGQPPSPKSLAIGHVRSKSSLSALKMLDDASEMKTETKQAIFEKAIAIIEADNNKFLGEAIKEAVILNALEKQMPTEMTSTLIEAAVSNVRTALQKTKFFQDDNIVEGFANLYGAALLQKGRAGANKNLESTQITTHLEKANACFNSVAAHQGHEADVILIRDTTAALSLLAGYESMTNKEGRIVDPTTNAAFTAAKSFAARGSIITNETNRNPSGMRMSPDILARVAQARTNFSVKNIDTTPPKRAPIITTPTSDQFKKALNTFEMQAKLINPTIKTAFASSTAKLDHARSVINAHALYTSLISSFKTDSQKQSIEEILTNNGFTAETFKQQVTAARKIILESEPPMQRPRSASDSDAKQEDYDTESSPIISSSQGRTRRNSIDLDDDAKDAPATPFNALFSKMFLQTPGSNQLSPPQNNLNTNIGNSRIFGSSQPDLGASFMYRGPGLTIADLDSPNLLSSDPLNSPTSPLNMTNDDIDRSIQEDEEKEAEAERVRAAVADIANQASLLGDEAKKDFDTAKSDEKEFEELLARAKSHQRHAQRSGETNDYAKAIEDYQTANIIAKRISENYASAAIKYASAINTLKPYEKSIALSANAALALDGYKSSNQSSMQLSEQFRKQITSDFELSELEARKNTAIELDGIDSKIKSLSDTFIVSASEDEKQPNTSENALDTALKTALDNLKLIATSLLTLEAVANSPASSTYNPRWHAMENTIDHLGQRVEDTTNLIATVGKEIAKTDDAMINTEKTLTLANESKDSDYKQQIKKQYAAIKTATTSKKAYMNAVQSLSSITTDTTQRFTVGNLNFSTVDIQERANKAQEFIDACKAAIKELSGKKEASDEKANTAALEQANKNATALTSISKKIKEADDLVRDANALAVKHAPKKHSNPDYKTQIENQQAAITKIHTACEAYLNAAEAITGLTDDLSHKFTVGKSTFGGSEVQEKFNKALALIDTYNANIQKIQAKQAQASQQKGTITSKTSKKYEEKQKNDAAKKAIHAASITNANKAIEEAKSKQKNQAGNENKDESNESNNLSSLAASSASNTSGLSSPLTPASLSSTAISATQEDEEKEKKKSDTEFYDDSEDDAGNETDLSDLDLDFTPDEENNNSRKPQGARTVKGFAQEMDFSSSEDELDNTRPAIHQRAATNSINSSSPPASLSSSSSVTNPTDSSTNSANPLATPATTKDESDGLSPFAPPSSSLSSSNLPTFSINPSDDTVDDLPPLVPITSFSSTTDLTDTKEKAEEEKELDTLDAQIKALDAKIFSYNVLIKNDLLKTPPTISHTEATSKYTEFNMQKVNLFTKVEKINNYSIINPSIQNSMNDVIEHLNNLKKNVEKLNPTHATSPTPTPTPATTTTTPTTTLDELLAKINRELGMRKSPSESTLGDTLVRVNSTLDNSLQQVITAKAAGLGSNKEGDLNAAVYELANSRPSVNAIASCLNRYIMELKNFETDPKAKPYIDLQQTTASIQREPMYWQTGSISAILATTADKEAWFQNTLNTQVQFMGSSVVSLQGDGTQQLMVGIKENETRVTLDFIGEPKSVPQGLPDSMQKSKDNKIATAVLRSTRADAVHGFVSMIDRFPPHLDAVELLTKTLLQHPGMAAVINANPAQSTEITNAIKEAVNDFIYKNRKADITVDKLKDFVQKNFGHMIGDRIINRASTNLAKELNKAWNENMRGGDLLELVVKDTEDYIKTQGGLKDVGGVLHMPKMIIAGNISKAYTECQIYYFQKQGYFDAANRSVRNASGIELSPERYRELDTLFTSRSMSDLVNPTFNANVASTIVTAAVAPPISSSTASLTSTLRTSTPPITTPVTPSSPISISSVTSTSTSTSSIAPTVLAPTVSITSPTATSSISNTSTSNTTPPASSRSGIITGPEMIVIPSSKPAAATTTTLSSDNSTSKNKKDENKNDEKEPPRKLTL